MKRKILVQALSVKEILKLAFRIGEELTHLFNLSDSLSLNPNSFKTMILKEDLNKFCWRDRNTIYEVAFLDGFLNDIMKYHRKEKIQNKTIIKFCHNLYMTENFIKTKLFNVKDEIIQSLSQLFLFYSQIIEKLKTKLHSVNSKKFQFRIQTQKDDELEGKIRQDNTLTRPSTTTGYRSSVLQKINRKKSSNTSSLHGLEIFQSKKKTFYSTFNNQIMDVDPHLEMNEKIKDIGSSLELVNEENEKSYLKNIKAYEKQDNQLLNKYQKKRQTKSNKNSFFNDNYISKKKSQNSQSKQSFYKKSSGKKERKLINTKTTEDFYLMKSTNSNFIQSKGKRKKALKRSGIKGDLTSNASKDGNKGKGQNEEGQNFHRKVREKLKRGIISRKKKNFKSRNNSVNLYENEEEEESEEEVVKHVSRFKLNKNQIVIKRNEKFEHRGNIYSKQKPQQKNSIKKTTQIERKNPINLEKQEKIQQLKTDLHDPYRILIEFHRDFLQSKGQENYIKSIFFKEQERIKEKQNLKLQKHLTEQQGSFKAGENFYMTSNYSNPKEEKIIKNQRDFVFQSDQIWIKKVRNSAKNKNMLVEVDF